jgi:hypothetical protein
MAERAPGVIVTVVPDVAAVAPPLFERYPCIIGAGETELPYYDENVERAAYGDIDPLAHSGVNRILQIGDIPGQDKYEEGVDFVLTGDSVEWLPGGSRPVTGVTYYVSYTTDLPASAFLPKLYFDGNTIISEHGNKTKVAGGINPAVVAAIIALDNGSKGVYIIQLDPSKGSLDNQYLDAIEKLATIQDVKLFVVPLDVDSDVTAALFNHCVIFSTPQRKQERTLVVPVAKNTDYATFRNMPSLFRHKRAHIPACYNGEVTLIGFSGTFNQVYAGVADIAKWCSGDVGQTYSDEPLSDFQCIADFTGPQIDNLVGVGVSPIKSGSGIPRLVMGITTDVSTAINEDLGIQDIEDYVKKYWRDGMWGIYRNARIVPGFADQLVNSSIGMLERLITDKIVTAYRDISAIPDPVEPRKFRMFGRIQPTFSLQWLDVEWVFSASV